MLRTKNQLAMCTMLLALGSVVALALYGCNSDQTSSQSGSTTRPSGFALFGPPPDKTGQELWADNCMRCHNGRPPEEFSSAQWEVIVHHMRLRANLTGDESRKIVAFLKAAH